MISVPMVTDDIADAMRSAGADDIRFAYEGNGDHIMFAKQVYHAARPYIILHQQYIISPQMSENFFQKTRKKVLTNRGVSCIIHLVAEVQQQQMWPCGAVG